MFTLNRTRMCIYIYVYIYIERERSMYTMDIHGIYRDLYIYHVQETEKQQKKKRHIYDFSFYVGREKGI